MTPPLGCGSGGRCKTLDHPEWPAQHTSKHYPCGQHTVTRWMLACVCIGSTAVYHTFMVGHSPRTVSDLAQQRRCELRGGGCNGTCRHKAARTASAPQRPGTESLRLRYRTGRPPLESPAGAWKGGVTRPPSQSDPPTAVPATRQLRLLELCTSHL